MKQSWFPVIARSPCDEAIHLAPYAELDCFAALAMTEKHLISLASLSVRLSGRGDRTGDDAVGLADPGLAALTKVRDLAAEDARVLLLMFRPLQSEGAGNAGCPMHPQPGVRWG